MGDSCARNRQCTEPARQSAKHYSLDNAFPGGSVNCPVAASVDRSVHRLFALRLSERNDPHRRCGVLRYPAVKESQASASEWHRRAAIRAACILGQAAITALLIVLLLNGGTRDFGAPLRFGQDSLAYLTQTKTTLDTGWWWNDPLMSAPSTFNALLFPSNSTVDQAIVAVVGLFTDQLGWAINITWITMLVLAGGLATYGFELAGVGPWPAACFGVLYALSPYGIYRNQEHFMLVTYLVPIPATAAVLILGGAFEAGPWRRWMGLLAGCGLIGLNYVYYAFFACFFVAVATLGRLAARWHWRTLAAGALVAGLISIATAVNLVPSLRAWSVDGKPVIIQEKVAAEAEVYGLKLRHLITPIWGHTVAPLAYWQRLDAWAHFPLDNENTTAKLGLIGSLGLAVGLLAIAGAARAQPLFGNWHVLAASQLLTAGILFGTIGGLGSVFNLFVATDIRGYSRIVVFLTFFALLVVAAVCDALWRRSRVWGGTLLIAVMLVGLWDQGHAFISINASTPEITREYRQLETFVQRLEQDLPPGSQVLQLPFTFYLNDLGRERMGIYDQLKPHLVSTHLHWSFPALSNEQFRWELQALRVATPDLPARMVNEGFAAILVDRYGYADAGQSVIAALLAAPGARMAHEDERYAAIDVRQVEGSELPRLRMTPQPATAGLASCPVPAIVSFDYVGGKPGPYTTPVRVRRDRDVRVAGWIVPGGGALPGRDLDVVVDGTPIQAYYGFIRPDVASVLAQPAYGTSGYVAVVPGAQLSSGSHSVTLRLTSADESCASESSAIVLEAR